MASSHGLNLLELFVAAVAYALDARAIARGTPLGGAALRSQKFGAAGCSEPPAG